MLPGMEHVFVPVTENVDVYMDDSFLASLTQEPVKAQTICPISRHVLCHCRLEWGCPHSDVLKASSRQLLRSCTAQALQTLQMRSHHHLTEHYLMCMDLRHAKTL